MGVSGGRAIPPPAPASRGGDKIVEEEKEGKKRKDEIDELFSGTEKKSKKVKTTA